MRCRLAPRISCAGNSSPPARCRATETAQGIGRRAPRRSRAGNYLSPARCSVWWSSHGALERDLAAHAAPPGSSTGRQRRRPKVLAAAPLAGVARGLLRRQRERRRRPKVLAAAPRAEVARGLLRRQRDAKQRTADGKMKCRRAPRRSRAGTSSSSARCGAAAAAECIGRRDPRGSCAGNCSSPARCRATADGKMSAAAPRAEVARDFLVTGEMPGDTDGQRYWPPRPVQKSRGTSWSPGRCRSTPTNKVLGSAPCAEVARGLLGCRGDARRR